MKVKGFTLIELNCALIILLISSLLAVHFSTGFYHRQASRADLHQLISLLNFSRVSALTLSRDVTVCPSQDQTTCGGAWQDGQIVFIAGKKPWQVQKLLRSYPRLHARAKLELQAFPSVDYLQYNPVGFDHQQNGRFIYTQANAEQRQILLNKSGRVRIV